MKLPTALKPSYALQKWLQTRGAMVFSGLGVTLLALWLSMTPMDTVRLWLDYMENATYDLRLRYFVLSNDHHENRENSPIVIVDIDDISLAKEGRWPWTRSKVARLVDKISEGGATVVALDIMFPEPEQNTVDLLVDKFKNQNINLPPDTTQFLQQNRQDIDADTRLITSLSKMDSVLGFAFHNNPDQANQGQLPAPLLSIPPAFLVTSSLTPMNGYVSNTATIQEKIKHGGFINAFPDLDGNIRKATLVIRHEDKIYPSLALQAVVSYLLTKNISAEFKSDGVFQGLTLDKTFIRMSPQGTVYIPFRGKAGSYPYISATTLLENQVAKKSLEGKIVFIGTSATGLGDLKSTAIDPVYPGVEVQASVADGILNNDFYYKSAWNDLFLTCFIIIIGLMTAIIWAYLTPKRLTIFTLLFVISLLVANQFLWSYYHLVISFVLPVLVVLTIFFINLAYGYVQESRRRIALKDMFGQYVPAEHVNQMLQSTIARDLEGESLEMTVLFADIRGFTSITEKMSAGEIKTILNDYLTPMTQIIFDNGGTIDKYVGDMIMAFWGAPLDDPDHARHGIKTALAMQKKLESMVFQTAITHEEVRLKIGIGVNTGLMNVGDMGSKFRRAYTVLGDAVNLGSRLESSCKFYGAKILVGEKTRQGQEDFLFRQIDRVQVKGKQEAITAFEPLCPLQDASPELIQEVEIYAKALEQYYNKNWDGADSLFTKLLKEHPGTLLYEVYRKRIHDFRHNPPPPDWDGVYVREVK